MTYATDEKLKSFLDTNQLHREQLCLAVLSLDKRFTDVRPRHPRGGRDGGRDIEALFRGTALAYGAVGFVNQAADVDEKKKTIRAKFADDLKSAVEAAPKPLVFVFFTNVNFTVSEKDDLVDLGKTAGLTHCEILDRERLRVALDSPDGFAARFQFLSIAMSEAEQASFFAKWGDEIQSVIATGFQEVHSTLAHLLFLQEAMHPLSGFHVQMGLDREYESQDIGHFRAFCLVQLQEPKLGILRLLIGSSDKANRFRTDIDGSKDSPGIAAGVGSGQWKVGWDGPGAAAEAPNDEPDEASATAKADGDDDDDTEERYTQIGSGSAVGMRKVKGLTISYGVGSLIRFEPVLSLMDFDMCMLMPILNESLATKLSSIRVVANGYLLLDLNRASFGIDRSPFPNDFDSKFSPQELTDPWVRIRPSNAGSAIRLSFSDTVPVRLFKSKKATGDEVAHAPAS